MTRNARKRAERIYTQRAKQGFPPVSNVILHNDGTIEDRKPSKMFYFPLGHHSSCILQSEVDEHKRFAEAFEKALGRPMSSFRLSWWQRIKAWLSRRLIP